MKKTVQNMGLTTEQAERSREIHGANVFVRMKRKSFLRKLLESFSDPIIRILLIAMTVNLVFTIKNINWAETVGIIIAIAISTVVSALSESSSEKAFEKLQEENRKFTVRVKRNGRITELPAEDVVVGDVIYLAVGEKIPADGSLIDGNIKVDESAINGESKLNSKTPFAGSALYSGSMIAEGEGIMCAEKVGKESIYGKIAMEIQTEKEESPLKVKLGKLAKSISKIGYFAAFLVAFTYLVNVFVLDSNFEMQNILLKITNLRFVAMSLIKAVTIAMTVIVVAVPEGLPMMITVVLSSNMKKMLNDHVLVRKLVGIETSGSLNILFTDKTGTITEGKQTFSEMVLGNGDKISRINGVTNKLKTLFEGSVLINTSCHFENGKPVGGNSTERALSEFAGSHDVGQAEKRIAFDSKNKFSAAEVRTGKYKGGYIKGAPEKIIPHCKKCYLPSGEVGQFDSEKMQKLISRLSKDGSSRILALALCEKADQPGKCGEMIFLAIAVLKDKIRKEAKESVKTLQAAGIHTVMITGDSKDTARSIATECGIYVEGKNIILTGNELNDLSDDYIMKKLPEISVIARALPQDKSRLVRLAKAAGYVAGMTGDGVNDAPALKAADVGFAMGSGTEIAKEAGDIVILDNNLASIVNAVLYGRTVFKSIRKFITFQLIMNLCAVGVTLIGQMVGIDHPITVIQMLWVNIIMDTLGGLAFAGEYPLRMYLKEHPVGREEPILTFGMMAQIITMGIYGTALCSFFLLSEKLAGRIGISDDPAKKLTAFFGLFIFTGIVICFTARSERINITSGLYKNKAFVLIMLLISAVQLAMLFYGGVTFRCYGMSMKNLGGILLLAATVLPVDLTRRILTKRINGILLNKSQTKGNKQSLKGKANILEK